MTKNLLVALATALCLTGCETISDFFDEPTASASTKNAYVITVGVENGYAGKCPGAKVDCTRMKSLLKPFAKKQICLVDSQATVKAVCAALEEGIKYDHLIFFYSGHGGSVPTAQAAHDATETDKNDEFICLYDTGLLDNSIWNIISKSKGRVTLIFDCCHSATLYRTPVTFARQRMKLMATNKISGTLDMQCWSGCSDNSYSYGSSSGGKFTNTLRKYYKKSLTYDKLWKKIESDSSLKKYEKVQRTIMGTDYSSRKVFQ